MPTRDIIVIGASSGGVHTLQALCRGLPRGLPAAVFVVCHMSAASPTVLPQVLSEAGPLPAENARNGQEIAAGRIYIAPPDRHLLLTPRSMALADGPRENRVRPAIDPLFRSAARAFGNRVIGVILSGALDDGTEGLLYIKRFGGVIIVQDPAEASVPDMPLSAIEHVGPDHILPVDQIAMLLGELAGTPAEPMNSPELGTAMSESSDISRVLHPAGISGSPIPITCPECNGAIWKIREGDLDLYRCHVGHSYTEQAMVTAKGEELEIALWTALRVLKESIAMYGEIGQRARSGGRPITVEHYAHLQQRAEEQAEVIKRALGV